MVGAFLLLLVSVASWYFYSRGYLLYYGDAQAHLNISRSWIDSRTPGYRQIGTVWLPLLHLICLPFVRNDFLWWSGLAATIPVACCFVIAGVLLYLCGRESFHSRAAGATAVLCFALNPNVLYLATITMTEIVFVAGLAACVWAVLQFRKTQERRWVAVAVAASWWMSLTRYDGWFLIPFIVFWLTLSSRNGRIWVFLAAGALASMPPIYWLAHNWWETGNALDFYNGPYSAAAIQEYKPYPGFHDWWRAAQYYWAAAQLCCGKTLPFVGGVGVAFALWRRQWLAIGFFSLTPLFYVWSIHGSWTPIHVPSLWPFSYYNTRYGLAVVVLMAFASGAIVAVVPRRWRVFGLLVPVLAAMPWLVKPSHEHWICWKESEHNSIARRAWTSTAASYLDQHYVQGEGVLTEFGDLTGIFAQAHVPLRETLHEGNGPTFYANSMPNGLVRQMKWAITQDGDKLCRRLAQASAYRVVDAIAVEGAPRVLIYERRYAEPEKTR